MHTLLFVVVPDGVMDVAHEPKVQAAASVAWDRHAREVLAAYPDATVVAIDAHL